MQRRKLQKKQTFYWAVWLASLIPMISYAQKPSESTLQSASLEQVVQYALVHQPAVRQAKLDEEITNKVIKGKLADWYPQISYNVNYQRNFKLNTFVVKGVVNYIGLYNTSLNQFTATQNIFNRDVLLASKTASNVRLQSELSTERSKVDVIVGATKAFYDLLAIAQQIKVSEESIVRLQKSLKDSYSRYTTGISDKTDYKRATILLGNAQALLKSNTELLKYKQEYLKTLIGYPAENELSIQYDTLKMESEIGIDTVQEINYDQHIDYKILNMQRELQSANLKYTKWALLPTISAYGSYNINFQNNNVGDLYKKQYPYSSGGVTLTLPLFQGFKRIAKIQEQKYTSDRLDVSLENLKNSLSTEYTRSIASYKSNLEQYFTQKENVVLAQEVYDVIQLQYRSGIKTYLDVTVAETDLHTTRISYYNALYQVLASKMDVQRALGQINY